MRKILSPFIKRLIFGFILGALPTQLLVHADEIASGNLTLSPLSCIIRSGESTCELPGFTWTTTGATHPNIFNLTTKNSIASSTAVQNIPITGTITGGNNTIQLRNSLTVLDTKTASGICTSGTTWSGGKCTPSIISGLLKHSDVLLSPRLYRDNWYDMFVGFHANRIVWTTVGPQILREGTSKNIAVQCRVPQRVPAVHERKDAMLCINKDGGYGGSPNDMQTGQGRPDINSSAWKDWQLGEAKKLIDSGCTSFQQDEALMNYSLVQFGGCYGNESMSGFTTYLDTKYTDEELRTKGVTDIKTFNYRYNSLPSLKNDFSNFQKESVKNYDTWFHDEVQKYASSVRTLPHLTWSANLTETQLDSGNFSWLAPYFDFLISEARADTSSMLATLLQMKQDMLTKDAVHGVTFVTRDVWLNRRSIATAYALGLVPITPWDVFIAPGADRYYGIPSDYSRLFLMPQNNPQVFDDYSDSELATSTYTSVIPSSGYIQSIDTTLFPKRTTIYWSERNLYKNIAENKPIFFNTTLATTTVNSVVGNLYFSLAMQSKVKAGDPVSFNAPQKDYLITVRKNNTDSNKKTVHIVSWKSVPTKTYIHLKKSDFPVPPRHIISSSRATATTITPITLGDYYIYNISDAYWTVLYP